MIETSGSVALRQRRTAQRRAGQMNEYAAHLAVTDV